MSHKFTKMTSGLPSKHYKYVYQILISICVCFDDTWSQILKCIWYMLIANLMVNLFGFTSRIKCNKSKNSENRIPSSIFRIYIFFVSHPILLAISNNPFKDCKQLSSTLCTCIPINSPQSNVCFGSARTSCVKEINL